ncbi:RNA polymerase sigma factor [Streptomyces liliifuscus]|uniref:Sigma-70 family RNA polymerase sigma factor n=1 Tax=Streptomyces liliifuscus TaxID=2797636 RepID=A0A7T7KUD4_9ACTN|nr:sigma-70 family RNA polymerase sigma factor [Streptomyces liliifuscus]QQM39080.1 sigma-70 family RNA polymerase sigma factor [Streptomyces liliifuscus]
MFEAHYRQVLRFAERRAGDAETAKDIASETFVVAWRRLDKVPDTPEESLPWLYGVARNVLANEQRGLRRGGRLSARLRRTTPVAPAAPDHAEGVVTGLHLREALGTLSERDREALQLVGWEGLDTQQAALVVGCSARAFAVRLHRARRRLESALARTEQEEPRGRLRELDGELGELGTGLRLKGRRT